MKWMVGENYKAASTREEKITSSKFVLAAFSSFVLISFLEQSDNINNNKKQNKTAHRNTLRSPCVERSVKK